jgi:hypothetical protein
MPEKIDHIEKAKRIRYVMEWILDDWSSTDIVAQIMQKWILSERQAKRYLADARQEWNQNEDAIIEQKRRARIESLKKQKRSLKPEYKGTPLGIRTLLAIDKEISKLENLYPAIKLDIGNKDGKPFKTTSTVNVNLSAKEIKKFANELENEV